MAVVSPLNNPTRHKGHNLTEPKPECHERDMECCWSEGLSSRHLRFAILLLYSGCSTSLNTAKRTGETQRNRTRASERDSGRKQGRKRAWTTERMEWQKDDRNRHQEGAEAGGRKEEKGQVYPLSLVYSHSLWGVQGFRGVTELFYIETKGTIRTGQQSGKSRRQIGWKRESRDERDKGTIIASMDFKRAN